MEKRARGKELKRKNFQKETLRSLRTFLEEKVNTLRKERKEPWVGRDSEETGHQQVGNAPSLWGRGGRGGRGLRESAQGDSSRHGE